MSILFVVIGVAVSLYAAIELSILINTPRKTS